jgi:hypothetical protein
MLNVSSVSKKKVGSHDYSEVSEILIELKQTDIIPNIQILF